MPLTLPIIDINELRDLYKLYKIDMKDKNREDQLRARVWTSEGLVFWVDSKHVYVSYLEAEEFVVLRFPFEVHQLRDVFGVLRAKRDVAKCETSESLDQEKNT